MKEIIKKFHKKHFNFLPGPVEIPNFSKKSFNFPIISQRNKDFEHIYFNLTENLKFIIDNTDGEIFILNGSGTLGMEAAIDNFIDENSNSLIISCGKFGDRFAEMLSIKGFKYKKLSFLKDRKVDYNIVENEIKNKMVEGCPYTHLLFQATETSSGIGVDLYKIKELKERYNLFLICDGISHILSNYFSQNLFNIDVFIFSSQKGLSSLAGTSFISILRKSLDKIVKNNKNYYTNLEIYKKNLIPFTPSITNIYNLWLNSIEIIKKGISDIIERNIIYRNKFRDFIFDELNLKEFPLEPSNSILVIEFTNSTKLVNFLYDNYRISIADGQGELKNNVFRVAFMGISNNWENYYFLLKTLKKEIKSINKF